MSTDPRIDAYIKKSAPFAKPILEHLRKLVHKAEPQVFETIKWGFPHFDHKGMLCSMAAFKQHCSFGFWKATLLKDAEQLLTKMGETNMGQFNKITAMKDLPPDKILISYIKEAVRLNDDGIKLPTKQKKAPNGQIIVPDALALAHLFSNFQIGLSYFFFSLSKYSSKSASCCVVIDCSNPSGIMD